MFYVLDAKRLTALEDENAKLKQLLAEAEPDKVMLKEIASMAREDRRASKNGPPSLLPSTIRRCPPLPITTLALALLLVQIASRRSRSIAQGFFNAGHVFAESI